MVLATSNTFLQNSRNWVFLISKKCGNILVRRFIAFQLFLSVTFIHFILKNTKTSLKRYRLKIFKKFFEKLWVQSGWLVDRFLRYKMCLRSSFRFYFLIYFTHCQLDKGDYSKLSRSCIFLSCTVFSLFCYKQKVELF